MLKPQDIIVALKLCRTGKVGRPSFAEIAADLKMAASEVHGAVKRCRTPDLTARVRQQTQYSHALGIPYPWSKVCLPGTTGAPTRGMLTAYAAPPLDKLIVSGDELPPVWPDSEGQSKGVAFEPLYKTVPFAARRDPVLYEYLALVDALRDARVREKKIAKHELKERLQHGG